jgi:hypothetical protein
MIVPFGHVLILAGILFLMGVFCAVARRNLIMVVLGVEIMLNAASLVFVGAALRWQQLEGQVFALFIFGEPGRLIRGHIISLNESLKWQALNFITRNHKIKGFRCQVSGVSK